MQNLPDRTNAIDIQRTEDPNQNSGYHSRVSIVHKFICMTIPKIARSRIKLTLHLLEGYKAPQHPGEIHDMGKRLADFETRQIEEMLASPDWFRFCFVRNPYDRLISAYNTQVGNTWNQQYAWLKDEINQAFGYKEKKEPPKRLISFRDFVHYLQNARDDILRDGHFNIQTRVLIPISSVMISLASLSSSRLILRMFYDTWMHLLQFLQLPKKLLIQPIKSNQHSFMTGRWLI